jgi:SecD/SecF fusion protein
MEQINVRGRTILILLITGLLGLSIYTNGIKLGQDLKGGTNLRFSLDIDRAIENGRLPNTVDRTQFVTDTIRVIEDRINKFGLANTTLLPVGDDKFEISLPTAISGSADAIVDVVTALGDLQFRIEVLPESQYELSDERTRRNVWPGTDAEFEEYKKAEVEAWKTARDAGNTEGYQRQRKEFYIAKIEGREGSDPNDFMVLEVPPKQYDFDGRILDNPRVGKGQTNQPVVNFDIKLAYQNFFGEWTGQNVKMPLAILLNGEVSGGGKSPIIQTKLTDSVQVTLGGQSFVEGEKRAKELATVLQTGSLKIRPELESKTEIGASLAGAARDRGVMAIIVAFLLVLVFMVVYYRAAGLVADVALLLNLVLLVGFLAFFQAVLTLPGIAGIVLTIGMAVDANILINERIREERRLGRSVRRALSEGYAKALSAIVDANVTSLITALFLYTYGSGPIKGFAITLTIGLIVSMFTAIYVTRTIFEWRLKNGGMAKLGTYGSQKVLDINWIGLRRKFVPLSVVLVILGLTQFSLEDKYTLYDIDFTGGYKLQAAFDQDTSTDEIKRRLAESGEKDVTIKIKEYDENDVLRTRERTLQIGPFPAAEVLSVGGTGRAAEIKIQRLFTAAKSEDVRESEQALAFEEYARELFKDRLLPDWLLSGPTPYTHGESDDPELAPFDGGLHVEVAFQDPAKVLTEEGLKGALTETMPYVQKTGSKRTKRSPAELPDFSRQVLVRMQERPAGASTSRFDIHLKSKLGDSAVERDPAEVRTNLGEFLGSPGFKSYMLELAGEARSDDVDRLGLSAAFPSQDQIGSSVAERLKNDAIVALFLALVGIIIYIAIRFNSRAMGFAAVLCLFHDVAITLGIVALTNQFGLVDAKINLAMVAAFLTLVGYSVNDTVVIFDRVREERGKRARITPEIINQAINLTLTRTIRTSITFLLVCIALFAFNFGQRNVLEGFSYLLIIGAFVGTYSTIAISSPLLLYLPWLWERIKGFAPNSKLLGTLASNPLTLILVPVAGLLWVAWLLVYCVVAFFIGLALFIPWALKEDVGDLHGVDPKEMKPVEA